VANEFLADGLYVILQWLAMLWGSLARGIPLGSQPVTIAPFVAPPVITFLKLQVVGLGVVGSLVAAVMIARRGEPGRAVARALPHVFFLLALGLVYLLVFTATTD
jgi:hypothetical protein